MASRRSATLRIMPFFFHSIVGQVQVEEHDHAGFGIEAGQGDDPDPHRHAQVVVQEARECRMAPTREKGTASMTMAVLMAERVFR